MISPINIQMALALAAAGAEVACEYLHRTMNPYSYVKGEGFLSARLYTKGNLSVQFILPDVGMKSDDILNSPQLLEVALYSKEEKSAQIRKKHLLIFVLERCYLVAFWYIKQ